MPSAALRPCPGSPTCPYFKGQCPVHQPRQAWQSNHGVERVRGRKLQRLREQLFAQEPFCRLCTAKGLAIPATIRDHIIPIAEGGTDDASNIQPLCEACSRGKTQAESLRGRLRG